jgi:hypothetical protein
MFLLMTVIMSLLNSDKFSAFHFSASTVIISIITLSMVILGGIFHFRLLDSYGIAFIFAPLRAVSQGIVVIFRRAHAAFDRLFVN